MGGFESFQQSGITVRGRVDNVWDNYAELDSTYHGTDITLDKRMSNGWMMTGGVSIGKNTGDIYGTGSDLNNPNFAFRRGITGNDTPAPCT